MITELPAKGTLIALHFGEAYIRMIVIETDPDYVLTQGVKYPSIEEAFTLEELHQRRCFIINLATEEQSKKPWYKFW